MKKLFLLPLCMVVLLTAGCSSDDEKTGSGTDTLELVKAPETISADGGEAIIEVTANNNIKASVEEGKDWCVFRYTVENSNIHLMIGENTGTTERTAVVTITAGTKELDVTITQAGLTFTIDFGTYEDKTVTVDYKEQTVRLPYIAGENVKVEGGFDVEWVTYDLDNNVIVLEITANDSFDERTAEATFRAGPSIVEFKIVQDEYPVPAALKNVLGTYDLEITGWIADLPAWPEPNIVIAMNAESEYENGVFVYNLFSSYWPCPIVSISHGYVEGDLLRLLNGQLIGGYHWTENGGPNDRYLYIGNSGDPESETIDFKVVGPGHIIQESDEWGYITCNPDGSDLGYFYRFIESVFTRKSTSMEKPENWFNSGTTTSSSAKQQPLSDLPAAYNPKCSYSDYLK